MVGRQAQPPIGREDDPVAGAEFVGVPVRHFQDPDLSARFHLPESEGLVLAQRERAPAGRRHQQRPRRGRRLEARVAELLARARAAGGGGHGEGQGGERGRAWFGASAALSENGRTALVSGYRDHARDGAAWVFEDNSELIEEPTTEPPIETTTGKGPTGTAGIGTQLGLGGVLSSKTTTLPAPTLAVNCNLVPLSGRVLVKLPGSKKFILLTGAIQVPKEIIPKNLSANASLILTF